MEEGKVKKEAQRIKTVTVDGITVSIDMEIMEDIETIEIIADTQDGNPLAMIKLFRHIFGKEYENIKKKLKGDARTLNIKKITDWFAAVMEAINAKN